MENKQMIREWLNMYYGSSPWRTGEDVDESRRHWLYFRPQPISVGEDEGKIAELLTRGEGHENA